MGFFVDMKNLFVRLTPRAMELLKKEATLQRRSMASIVEALILRSYGDTEQRKREPAANLNERLDLMRGYR